MKLTKIKETALAAMFLALGLLLPILTGPELGMILLPMHIPVFLCGLILGPKYGFAVGFVVPLMRSAIFGFPIMFPMALSMAVELAAYGLISGFLYSAIKKWQIREHGFSKIIDIWGALIPSMIIGRIIWGLAMFGLLAFGGGRFTFAAFLTGAFTAAGPGIIIQLMLIPALVAALERTGLVPLWRI